MYRPITLTSPRWRLLPLTLPLLTGVGCVMLRPPPPPEPVVVVTPVPRPPAQAPVKLKWKVEVGKTTYRSTLHVAGGKIVINSNGYDWNSTSDRLDGVWIFTYRGDLMAQIVPPGEGQKDANGVAITSDRLVFATDQGSVYTYDWTGTLMWEAPFFRDIEMAPVLLDINRDGVMEIALGLEEGDFYLINGLNGKIIHRIYTEEGPKGTRGFMAPAVAYDVTGDGVDDLFIPGKDGRMRAINGFSGIQLWTNRRQTPLYSAPILVDTNADGLRELIYATWGGEVVVVEARTGLLLWSQELERSKANPEGIFAGVGWLPEAQCVLVATARSGEGEGVYCVAEDGIRWRYTLEQGRISSGFVLADVDETPGAEIVFGTESGKLVALKPNGELSWIHTVGGAIECTPSVADLDGDGQTDIVVAANDGYLRVFGTPGQAPPRLSYSRGDGRNTGRLEIGPDQPGE